LNAVANDLNGLSDEALVALSRESNEEAFTLLVSRCTAMLRSLSARYRHGLLDSEDLVQEGLLGLLSAVRTFTVSQSVSFRTYAYACMRNRIISALRKKGAESESLENEDEFLGLAATDSDPISLVVKQEESQLLQARLRERLTMLEYRVLMAHLNGFSYREIASRLEISEKAVDNALQRVRRKMTANL
jgi:RNA polymerase sporulation-specific sigma factor